jgi:hypothetical protein
MYSPVNFYKMHIIIKISTASKKTLQVPSKAFLCCHLIFIPPSVNQLTFISSFLPSFLSTFLLYFLCPKPQNPLALASQVLGFWACAITSVPAVSVSSMYIKLPCFCTLHVIIPCLFFCGFFCLNLCLHDYIYIISYVIS